MTKNGVTLTETLVVIGIVVLIAAIAFPILTAAKKRALAAQEISQLRNLSVGHGIYLSRYDDVDPGSSIPLIQEKLLPPSAVALVDDPFPEGWGNLGRKGQIEPRVPYKDSFRTLKMSVGVKFFPSYATSTNGGWLISAAPNLKDDFSMFQPGNLGYRRLTYGGSVIKRRFPVIVEGDKQSINMNECFTDDEIVARRR